MTSTSEGTRDGQHARATTIEAPPEVPTIVIVREFDAEPARVFRAWTDGEQ